MKDWYCFIWEARAGNFRATRIWRWDFYHMLHNHYHSVIS